MIALNLHFDAKQLAQLGYGHGLLESQVQMAARRAVAKTSKRLMTRVNREVRKDIEINAKAVKARLGEFKKGIFTRKIWLGLNAVPASAFGKPVQTPSGVRVGSHNLPHAFLVKKYGNQVYERLSDARYPIKLSRIDISQKGESAMQKARHGIDEIFTTILLQEINYELIKKANK